MSRSGDLTLEECDALERALLIGLARQPLPAVGLLPDSPRLPGTAAALAGLALVAQRRRFVRPSALQPKAAPRSFPDDARPILPPPARKALARLVQVSGGKGGSLLAAALKRTAMHGWRLHPFDLPWLIAAVGPRHPSLGPSELAYDTMLRPAYPFEMMTAENWHDAPRWSRVSFLSTMRGVNPDRARDLLQSCWADQPAKVRAELLVALDVRLSPADRGFLEKAATDRAPSVRQQAATLLADVPGTPAHAARIADLASRFTIRNGTLAATLAPHRHVVELLKELRSFTLDELAQGLGVTTADLVVSVRSDEPNALLAVVALAGRSQRADIVMKLLKRAAGTPWTDYTNTIFPALRELPLADRLALLPVLGPLALDPFPEFPLWNELASLVGVLPIAEATAILESPAWRSFKTACADGTLDNDMEMGGMTINGTADDRPVVLATMMPAALAGRFAAEIADLPLRSALPIQAFAEFVTALDAATPSVP